MLRLTDLKEGSIVYQTDMKADEMHMVVEIEHNVRTGCTSVHTMRYDGRPIVWANVYNNTVDIVGWDVL